MFCAAANEPRLAISAAGPPDGRPACSTGVLRPPGPTEHARLARCSRLADRPERALLWRHRLSDVVAERRGARGVALAERVDRGRVANGSYLGLGATLVGVVGELGGLPIERTGRATSSSLPCLPLPVHGLRPLFLRFPSATVDSPQLTKLLLTKLLLSQSYRCPRSPPSPLKIPAFDRGQSMFHVVSRFLSSKYGTFRERQHGGSSPIDEPASCSAPSASSRAPRLARPHSCSRRPDGAARARSLRCDGIGSELRGRRRA